MVIRILVSGALVKSMDMVFTNGKMETATRASGTTVSKMAKAPISLRTETPIQVITSLGSHMALETTSGKMGHPMLATSLMVSKTALASGKKMEDQTVTSMMAIFLMI